MKNLLYIVFLFVFVSACSTKPENKPYCWDDDLHRRLLTDFCLTESQVKDYIRKYIPDVTDGTDAAVGSIQCFGVHGSGW